MLKRICLGFILLCGIVMAEVNAIDPEFKSLLRNDGVMEKNTLKLNLIENGDGERTINAKGDLIVTGVLVSTLNNTYFYPDKNLKNLFFDVGMVLQCVDEKTMSACLAIKPSKNTPIHVGSDVVSKNFGGAIYGRQAVRVKAHISNYHYFDTAMSGDLYVTMKNIFALTPPKKSYALYPTGGLITKEFGYGSKDDYVNIRKAPKGAIVGQIQKADMKKPKSQRGIIVGANCHEEDYYESEDEAIQCGDTNGWYEVFYFPPGIRHGKDAIHGYIHKSQLKF